MIYLITNIFFNRGIYNIEGRNIDLEKIYIKSNDKNLEIEVGNFVTITKISGKNSIDKIVDTPSNYLDFYPKGKLEYTELYESFREYYDSIKNDTFKIILDETIFKNLDYFKFPAAKSIHHAYIGGLAEHTLNMLKLSHEMIKLYDLNQEMLWMGIILHDYSKITEMTYYGLTYSTEGNLIGHLVMTVEEIVKICTKYNIDNDMNIITLKHLILSHHGRLDYGSPKEPMTKEAYILSQLDEIDAKMNILIENFNQLNDNEMTTPIPIFDKRRFFNYVEVKEDNEK